MFSPASGQLLKGEVTGLGPDGRIFLNIGGMSIEARSEVALKPGAVVWFEVQQSDPLWLRLADGKGAAQEFLRQYFSDPAALGKGMEALLALADSAGPAGGMADLAGPAIGPEADPRLIVRMLALLGLARPGAEAAGSERIRELFPELAHSLAGLEGKAETAVLRKLALLMELQQQLNTAAPVPNHGRFFLLPCFFAFGAGHGQWLLVLDREDGQEAGSEGRGYALSFFLSLSRLGELQIQLKVRGKSLSGEFWVENAGARNYLASELAGLEDLLKGLGYAPVALSCRVARTSMLESFKAGIEAAAGLERVSLVDLRA